MTSPIPILHVINRCADGSISRIVERIIGFSPPGEFEWHVCAVRGQDEFAEKLEQVGAHFFDCAQQTAVPPWQQIQQYLLNHKIRLVHSHTPRTILEVWKAKKFRHSAELTGVVHLATKHLLTKPADRKGGMLFAAYDRLTLYLPDHLVPVSHTMAREILTQPGIKKEKVTTIPNAIPVTEYYQPDKREAERARLGLTRHLIAIGFTGRLEKVKNLPRLLEAFRLVYQNYPSTRLVLIGEGELQPVLQAQAQRLGIAEAVLWPGFCTDIPQMLAALDIYVQPSLNEGLSLSILEAMAARKPVVATKVGSALEIIQDRQTGILVRPNSVTEIAEALMNLVSDSSLQNRLSRAGNEFVFKEYDLPKMVNEYFKVYRKLGEKPDEL